MKALLLLSTMMLTFVSCKKENEQPTGGAPAPINPTTPTTHMAAITLHGITYTYTFGQNGYTSTGSNSQFELMDSTIFSAHAGMQNWGQPGTTDEGGFTIYPPSGIMATTTWNADRPGAFIGVFAGTTPLYNDWEPAISFVDTDGAIWNSHGAITSGAWVNNYVVEESTDPAEVRAHGEFTIMVHKVNPEDTTEAIVKYTLPFTQPH